MVKNPPTMWETWVHPLGWEDPLEKGMVTHPSTPAWRIPWATVHGVTKSQTWLSDFHLLILLKIPTKMKMLCKYLLVHGKFKFCFLKLFEI